MCTDRRTCSAAADREARSLELGSKASTPSPDDDKASSSKAAKPSDYEVEKQLNIEKNRDLL